MEFRTYYGARKYLSDASVIRLKADISSIVADDCKCSVSFLKQELTDKGWRGLPPVGGYFVDLLEQLDFAIEYVYKKRKLRFQNAVDVVRATYVHQK